MFLYIKTNILRGYGIFKNDFAHPREPANGVMLGNSRRSSWLTELETKVHTKDRNLLVVLCLTNVLNVIALVGTFNQEKALVGAFSMITNLRVDLRFKL